MKKLQYTVTDREYKNNKVIAKKRTVTVELPADLPLPVNVADVTNVNGHDMLSWQQRKRIDWASEEYNQPTYTSFGGNIEFELWYSTGFGWVIPTLTIKNARKWSGPEKTRRTYAISVKDSKLVSCGMGPHVKVTLKVTVRKSRFEALKPLLDLLLTGEEKAGDYRDQLSSRRAQTSIRRRGGNLYGW